jgi:HEAT repeat protein
MGRAHRRVRFLTVATFGLLSGCSSTDRAYNGRSAESWATQLTAERAHDRVIAADALYHVAPQSDAVVNALLRAMRDSDPEVQRTVVVALSTIGPRAIPGMTAAVEDDHASVRSLAIELLAQQGSASIPALPEITRALRDPDDQVRRAAASALRSFEKAAQGATASLTTCARNGTPELRAECLTALAAVSSDTSTVLALASASLSDGAAVVRRTAVRITTAFVDKPTPKLNMLLPLMRDEDTSVRLETYRAVGGLLNDASVGAVARAALVMSRSDRDSSARVLVQRLLEPRAPSQETEAEQHHRQTNVEVRRP